MSPYIQYELNKEFIIKTLCVERNMEVNTCQGKCHLNKEIEKNADKEEPHSIPSQNPENEIFFISLYGFNSPPPGTISNIPCLYFTNYRFLIENNHFHPPEIS